VPPTWRTAISSPLIVIAPWPPLPLVRYMSIFIELLPSEKLPVMWTDVAVCAALFALASTCSALSAEKSFTFWSAALPPVPPPEPSSPPPPQPVSASAPAATIAATRTKRTSSTPTA
jgi:hypothetical protein